MASNAKRRTREVQKKELELAWFLKFQAKFAECPQEQPVLAEKPDILLPSSRVGIEITEFYSDRPESGGSQLERIRRNREEMIQRAKEIFQQRYQQRLTVGVDFQHEETLSRAELESTAMALAAVVQEAIAEPEDVVCLDWRQLRTTELRQHVAQIEIWKMRGNGPSLWFYSMFGSFSGHPEAIKASLLDKESKLPEYRSRCSKVWLLIVAKGHEIHSQIDDTDERLNSRFVSSFDRAFIYDVFGGWVKEIRLNPPAEN